MQLSEGGRSAAKRKARKFAGTTGRTGGIKFNPKAVLDKSQVKDRRNPRYRSR